MITPPPVDRFLDDALRHQLDRRQMVRRALALGVSLPALSVLLAQRTSARQATPAATPLGPATPPVAERRPEIRTFSGVDIEDPYAWLEDPDDPAVIAYLDAENAYREAIMAPTADLQEALYAEMVGRIQETDSTVPVPLNGYFYYTRYEEGQQYEIVCRKQGSLDAPEEILLDLNEMAGDYIALGFFITSPNQRYLAYSINEDGGIEYTMSIKDLDTGEILPGQFPNTDSMAWAADNQTIFYTRQDDTLRSAELYRHVLGDDPADDPLLFAEEDETFYLYVYPSDDRQYLFASSGSYVTTEVRTLPTSTPDAEWQVFSPRREGILYSLEHDGDAFLVLTNDDAVNFKLMAAPDADPDPAAWTEIIPHRAEALLEGCDVFAGWIVIYGRENGLTQIWVRDSDSGEMTAITFDEPVYTTYSSTNLEYDTTKLRFEYTSLVTPFSTYEYDMATGERTLLKQDEIIGGHDPSQYVSERLVATAADGVAVPISLVRLRDRPAGPAPLRLDGYGAYGITSDPVFSVLRLTLINRGMTYAIAHVRGGQELGRLWYEDGKLLDKKNTFTDFIACAEHLVDQGETAPDRLLAMGGSAGGMLMGAVANMRPDLFRVIVANVPFVDVLRTMLDPSLPLTTGEYVEWGNPAEPAFFDYMQSYSPYDNVAAQEYPALLITGGIDDDQVPYWQPAKWTAALRYLKTGDNLLLLRMNMGAGHGGASGRYDFWREVAHDYAAMLLMLGMTGAESLAPAMATPVAARRATRSHAGGAAIGPAAALPVASLPAALPGLGPAIRRRAIRDW